MIHIPEELLEQVDRGNVIPLLGSLVNRGVLPTSSELAKELAARCDYPANEPMALDRVAAYYLLTTHDRHALVTFLKDRLDRPDVDPARDHRLIAQLRPRVIMTCCYDQLMARAAQEAELAYTPVIRNEEVAYDDEQKTMLVWLRGTLQQPDSLIITEDDHRRFLSGRDSLSDVLRGELARRTWLFIGFDLQEEWFPNYFDSVTHGLDHHRRRAYIVGTTSSAYSRAWWSARAQMLDVEIQPFLEELLRQKEARREPEPEQPMVAGRLTEPEQSFPLPERPYKLLDFYEARDAAIFFGREADTQKLTSLIHAHRLTLLYGASGTGKTSLLLASVMPRLTEGETGYAVFYLRAFEDLDAVIRGAVRRRCPELNLSDALSLVDFLDAAAKGLDSTLVLIVDQFEEFFIRFTPERRQAFIAELGALYDARDVPVKIVLSLREDWLASINEIRERIPEVFYIAQRLLPLTRQQAQQAIVGPAQRLEVRYDPKLVERLLDDLTERTPQNASALVMPPQLQLVCHALYERVDAEGRRFITVADYEEIGRAEGILVRYIEGALQEHREKNREIARRVLTALVTSHGTKTGTHSEALAAEVEVEETDLAPILARLISQRLVRRLEEGNTYELAHDILADTIAGWISEEELRRKEVQEALTREVADWRNDSRVLLGRAKFERVNTLRDHLRLTEEQITFLLRAAIFYDAEVPYWLGRIDDRNIQLEILLEMMEREPTARMTVAKLLADFPHERAADSLGRVAVGNLEPAVREVAAISLAQGRHVSAIAHLGALVRRGTQPEGSHALRALAVVRDIDPGLVTRAALPQFQLAAALATLRLQRAAPVIRAMTAAGAVGGSLAFGLGLLPSVGLHFLRISSFENAIFVTLLLSALGVLAGALMGLGISVGGTFAGPQAAAGRVAGGVISGAASTAIALLIVSTAGEGSAVLQLAGAGLFGAAIAAGITLPMARATEHGELLWVGGALGGILGYALWGMAGLTVFREHEVALSLQLMSGGLTGLIMAVALGRAYQNSSRQTDGKNEIEDHGTRIITTTEPGVTGRTS